MNPSKSHVTKERDRSMEENLRGSKNDELLAQESTGRLLPRVSSSCRDNLGNFWSTSSGALGLGSSMVARWSMRQIGPRSRSAHINLPTNLI